MSSASRQYHHAAIRVAGCLSLTAGLLAAGIQPSTAAPPVHDMFASAKVIRGAFGTSVGSTAEGTKERGEPDHAGVLGNKSVWYRWTAPRSGRVAFDTISGKTTFDTVLAVYTGDRQDALTHVAGNDDAAGRLSRLTFRADRGVTYRVAIDGIAGKSGEYRLHWAMTPANDDFARSQRITRRAGIAAFTDNSLATKQARERTFGSHSVWYSWTAPASRQVTFSTRGSQYDTILAVFRGTRLPRLVGVTVNDDARGLGLLSRVRFDARAGRTYRIAITSFDRFRTGRTSLIWR